MALLFSDIWIKELQDAWNNNEEVSGKLAEVGFTSTITCGFKDEQNPSCVFEVQNGQAISAGLYNGETADWDMRASEDDWMNWVKKPPNMPVMSLAFSMGSLKFNRGNFKEIITTPSLATPFIKSFALMHKIGAD